MQNSNSEAKKLNGFTLVEVIVAIVILSLGILAVSQMSILGVRASRVINRQMYARDLLNRYYEMLHGLPSSDTTYLRHRTSTNLNDTTAQRDYEINVTTLGGRFRVIWNVRDGMIGDSITDNRFKTVRIHLIPRIGAERGRGLTADLVKRL
mgnify:CR=1 FL=1|jgi:prepilin-type N-terminal cleavage/methylation domain-containing protein